MGEKFKVVQGSAAYVQNGLGAMASTVERTNNLVNFSVPFMSWIMIACLMAASAVLYFIPVRYVMSKRFRYQVIYFPSRYLIMIWGCVKFTKKLIRPHHVSSSEFLNFLSRVPDDPTLRMCKHISLQDPVLLQKEEERRNSRKGKDGGGGKDGATGPSGRSIAKRVSSFFDKSRTNSPAVKIRENISASKNTKND